MGATTKLSFEDYLQIPDEPGKRYELDEGELIVEPSPTFRHNRVRSRVARHLEDFIQSHKLGLVTIENDFRLSTDTVRDPDVAFVTNERLTGMDVDRSPVDGVPDLAIKVVSPSNSAERMLKKVHQYLGAGCRAVWVFYPNLKVVEVYDAGGIREVAAPANLKEEKLFPGHSYSLPLEYVFDDDITK